MTEIAAKAATNTYHKTKEKSGCGCFDQLTDTDLKTI